jgi:RNA recognition motif-containing protein
MQNNKLFVRNISFNTTDGDLSGLFATHGDVLSTRIITDRDTGRPRGFAFVEMSTPESAQAAIQSLDNTQFNGRTLYVVMSEEQRERRPNTAYGRHN